jgi:transcriptional regulator with XRE-family HTH domain
MVLKGVSTLVAEERSLPQPPKRVVSNKEIGQRLKLLRQERGTTQEDLAEALGMTQPNISAIERGARGATLHQVIRFAKALGVSTDEILLREKAPTPGKRPRKRLMRQLQRIEELPRADQKMLLQLLDGLLKHREEKKRRQEEKARTASTAGEPHGKRSKIPA